MLAAVFALLLAGCGGGGSSGSTESTTRPAAKEVTGQQGEAAAGGQKADSGGPASNGTAQVGKHGPHVAVPKGPQEPKITPQQRARATTANIALSSPALNSKAGAGATLAATYTCDGSNISPPLSWRGVPADAVELVLFGINVQPVKGELFFDWAVAGLDPNSSSIKAGRLPPGAVVGRNGFGRVGYSICPPKGSAETYVFALYALPEKLSPKRGFDPAALRERALKASGNAGLMSASYARE